MVKGLKGSKTSRANLEMLNLKSCTYVRVREHLYFFIFLLQVRNLKNNPSVILSAQDLAVFSFTQLLGDSLRELDLTSCVNVTDLSVCAIATYLQKLVVLRLGWCKEITDWGLLGMVQKAQSEPDDETVGTNICTLWASTLISAAHVIEDVFLFLMFYSGRSRSEVYPDVRQHGLL